MAKYASAVAYKDIYDHMGMSKAGGSDALTPHQELSVVGSEIASSVLFNEHGTAAARFQAQPLCYHRMYFVNGRPTGNNWREILNNQSSAVSMPSFIRIDTI